jgi:hypothetical protein
LIQGRGDLTLLPPAILRLDTAAAVNAPPVATRGRLVRPGQPAPPAEPEPSWWTARAKADVKPGFTREEILAAEVADAAADRTLLDRVSDLLAQLSGALVPR